MSSVSINESKTYGVYQIVDALNKELSGDRDIKFHVSERRTSLSHLQSSGIIDYAKIDKDNVMHVYLIKNMDDLPDDQWRDALVKMSSKLESKLAGQDINTRYSWSKGKYLSDNELTSDIRAGWGETENLSPSAMRQAFDKVDTANVNKLYDLKDDMDPSVADDGARAANFIKYIKSGPTVVVPKQLWRNMGWSALAIDNNITVKYPEAGSDILAILRTDFEKVVGIDGFTVTEEDVELLAKPRTNWEGSDEVRIRSQIDAFYKQVNGIVSRHPAIEMAQSKVTTATQSKDDALIKEAESEYREAWKAAYDHLIKGRLADQYEDLMGKMQVTPSYMEEYTNQYWQSVANKNIEIITNKMIQIRKHPKYEYFIIKNISGTPIPTY